MSLLFPLYLLGALAIAVPVLLHLTGRPPKDRTAFSSLMFLKKTETPLKKRRKVEDPLLMLLRCLAIALLAFLFTRPFFGSPPKSILSDPEELVVIAIDTSASMRREGAWEKALAKADELLQATTKNDRVAVYHFDRDLHPLMTFETWGKLPPSERLSQAREAVKALEPGWQETRLGQALVGMAEAMEDDDVEQQRSFKHRRLILVTDLQAGSRLDQVQTYEWPPEIQLEIADLELDPQSNASVHAVRNDDLVPGENQAVRIRVRNAAESERSDYDLQWVGTSTSNRIRQIAIEPGQSRTVLFPGVAVEQQGRELALNGDDITFDNRLFLAPPVKHRVHVLFLSEEDESDTDKSLYYLRRVLQPSGAIQPVLHRAGDESVAFTGIDFMVVTDVLDDAQVQAVKEHLRVGKDALFVLHGSEQAASLGRVLDREGLVATAFKAADYSMLDSVDYEHPLLKHFQGKVYGDFTGIRFWQHRRIDPDAIPEAHVLARFENGDPAWLDVPVGKGSLYVMTSGWRPSDSQFALSSKFLPLLFTMIEQSGRRRVYQNQFAVGDVVPLPEEEVPMKLTGPDGATIELPTGTRQFADTDRPGLYTVILPNRAWRFAVNLDPLESKTDVMEPGSLKQLEALARKAEQSETDDETRAAMLGADRESRQKFWKRLLLVLLAVVGVETLVAGLRKPPEPIEVPA